MNQKPGLQQILFQQIKCKMPDNLSFVHEIAELLEISYDSAYRRIRGEKELSLEEINRLVRKYEISLDLLLGLQSNHVIFSIYAMQSGNFTIREWLLRILEDIRNIHSAPLKEVYYSAKDPPIFHYFHFPEIAAFKYFFWEKTIFGFPEYENILFRIDDANPEIVEIGDSILRSSMTIPTIEIWNEDTFIMLMKQIEYYWISGYFSRKDDMLNLLDKLEKWVRHIRKQAELGYKFLYGHQAEGIENSFRMYENEILLNDDTILVKQGENQTAYLTYNAISLLVSHDPEFCAHIEQYMKQMMRISNLISVSGEKERNRFFNKLLHSIEKTRLGLDIY